MDHLKMFPESLVNALLSRGNLPKSIDLNGDTGNTSYIDFINVKDVPQSVCFFIDRSNRIGLCLRVRVRPEYCENPQNFILTYFRRYSNGQLFVCCINHDGKDNRGALLKGLDLYVKTLNPKYTYMTCPEEVLPPSGFIDSASQSTALIESLIKNEDPVLEIC